MSSFFVVIANFLIVVFIHTSSCNLTGSCGCPGQWQRQIQSVDISCDDWCDSTSNLCVTVWQVLKVTWPLKWSWQNMAWWRQWQSDSYYCVWYCWWCERFPTSSSVYQFEGYLRFPNHERTWQIQLGGAWSLFSFLMVFLFDFWFFFDDLTLFISACFHIVENMRGLNEYARAKYHGAWAAGQDTTDVSGEVTMLVTTYSGLRNRPDTVIWWCHYAKVTRTTKYEYGRGGKLDHQLSHNFTFNSTVL